MLPTSATRRSATGIHGVKSIGTCSKPRRERFQLRRGERQTACLMAAGHIFLSGRKSALSRPTPPPHLCKNGRRRRRRGCISQGCSRLFIRDTFTVAPRWPLSLRLSPVFHYKVPRLGKQGAIAEKNDLVWESNHGTGTIGMYLAGITAQCHFFWLFGSLDLNLANSGLLTRVHVSPPIMSPFSRPPKCPSSRERTSSAR